jgi:hypothetical protein
MHPSSPQVGVWVAVASGHQSRGKPLWHLGLNEAIILLLDSGITEDSEPLDTALFCRGDPAN